MSNFAKEKIKGSINHMRTISGRLRLFVWCAIINIALQLSAVEPKDSLNVLWIGNSFTFVNDVPSMVQKLANSQNIKLSCTEILKSGETLKGHLTNTQLKETLAKGGWDYVIVQEQSSITAGPTTSVQKNVYPYAQLIDSLILEGSPQAKVIFYMTWGHKYGNIRKGEYYVLDDDYIGMQERVKTSYIEMAHMNNAMCAPVGMAWKVVREEKPNLQLYKQDCYHPSLIGSYLSANVIFSTILLRRYQSDFDAGLSLEIAEYIQQLAQNTVFNNKKLLNIGD